MSKSKTAAECERSLKQSGLIDAALEKMNFSKDVQLANAMGVAPARVSKVRNGRIPAGEMFIVNLHESSGMAIREIKGLLGLPCLDRAISTPLAVASEGHINAK